MPEGALPVVWRDGSTGFGPRPHLGLFPDCSLVNGVLLWDSCEPCQPGRAYDSDLDTCRMCPTGQFQNRSGARTCETVRPGWFIFNTSDPSRAALCPVGHECQQSGTVLPQPCPPGSFADVPGQAACKFCPSGKYGNSTGASSCTSCTDVLAGGITSSIASKSASDCICPLETFRPEEGDYCSPCPEGMDCQEGSDMRHLLALMSMDDVVDIQKAYPRVNRGYMARASNPLVVYRCVRKEQCPGGDPGTCASRRDPTTVACGDCLSGSFELGDACQECGDADVVPMILSAFASILAVTAITLAVNRNAQNTPASSFAVAVVVGLLFTNVQTLGVVHTMDLPWEEPVKSMLRIGGVLSFDLDMLKGACVTGVHPVRSFGLRQTPALLLVPVVLLTLLLKKCVLNFGNTSANVRTWAELCNTTGTLWSFLFISIVISAADPLICYEHPGGAGESVTSAPSLLCFQGGDHTAMVLIGALAGCLDVLSRPLIRLGRRGAENKYDLDDFVSEAREDL